MTEQEAVNAVTHVLTSHFFPGQRVRPKRPFFRPWVGVVVQIDGGLLFIEEESVPGLINEYESHLFEPVP